MKVCEIRIECFVNSVGEERKEDGSRPMDSEMKVEMFKDAEVPESVAKAVAVGCLGAAYEEALASWKKEYGTPAPEVTNVEEVDRLSDEEAQ